MLANRLNVLVTIMLAVMLLVMELSSAQMDDYRRVISKPATGETRRKYCGKDLSDALQTVCNGVYNTLFKNSDDEEMEMVDYPATCEYSVILPREKANAIFCGLENKRHRRYTPGIYEECCLNMCTVSELETYCG